MKAGIKPPKAIVLLDLNEETPPSPRSQLPATLPKQNTPSFTEQKLSPRAYLEIESEPFAEKFVPQPLSPELQQKPIADIDLASIAFNTPPNEGEDYEMPINDMSSISNLAGPDQTTSVIDH